MCGPFSFLRPSTTLALPWTGLGPFDTPSGAGMTTGALVGAVRSVEILPARSVTANDLRPRVALQLESARLRFAGDLDGEFHAVAVDAAFEERILDR